MLLAARQIPQSVTDLASAIFLFSGLLNSHPPEWRCTGRIPRAIFNPLAPLMFTGEELAAKELDVSRQPYLQTDLAKALKMFEWRVSGLASGGPCTVRSRPAACPQQEPRSLEVGN